MDDRHCQAFLKVSDARSVKRKEVTCSTGNRDGGNFFSKEKVQLNEKKYRTL